MSTTNLPTVLFVKGWRFLFFENEGSEPLHIHCRKGELECKYCFDAENFAIEEAYSCNMDQLDKREVKKLIFEYF